MTYGEDKTRDMIESLLPSTRRKSAREDRQSVHRNARRTFKHKAHDLDNDKFDLNYYPNAEIHRVKWERRGADNVSAFIRWAKAITKDLPKEERLPFVKRLLPDNTIGRHALSHIDWMEHFKVDSEFDENGWFYGYKLRQARIERENEQIKANVSSGLYSLVERRLHQKFNQWMRRHHTSGHLRYHRIDRDYCEDCKTPLVYRGLGNEQRFVDAMFSRSQHAQEWREAANGFFNKFGYQ